MIGNNLKVFLILRRLTDNTDEPLLTFLEKDINQASLFFEGYVENYQKRENFVLKMIGEFVNKNELKSKNITIKRIYKNIKKIKEEYVQTRLSLNNYIIKQDKNNMVDNLISIFRGKIIK